MSGNNIWILYCVDDRGYSRGSTWYGWDESADHIDSDHGCFRDLYLDDAITTRSFDSLMDELGSDGDKPEHGALLVTKTGGRNISKLPDGTSIRIIED